MIKNPKLYVFVMNYYKNSDVILGGVWNNFVQVKKKQTTACLLSFFKKDSEITSGSITE